MSCNPCYIPSCAPSCTSYPVGGLGSLCSPCGGLSSHGGLSSFGGGVSSSSLGLTSGASVSCINQLPASEVIVQPAPFTVVVPGPVLAASCEPVRVGGYTACGGGSGGSSYGRLGLCQPSRRVSVAKVCGSPC